MARDLISGTLSELDKQQVNPVFFVEAEFSTGFLRLWTGVNNISWDGKTWTGAGQLLNIEPARETTNISATGIRISLNGLDAGIVSSALNAARQNKPVNAYIGFLDASGNIRIDPYKFFSGLVDILVIEETGETSIITLQAESRLISLNRVKERRYTDQDQRLGLVGFDFSGESSGSDPTDLGFEHVVAIQEWAGQWGGGPIPLTERELAIQAEEAAEAAKQFEKERDARLADEALGP